MSRPRKGGRALAALRTELSERDLAIVRDVRSLRLIGARQIERMHFPPANHATALTAARSCRRVLERLTRDRLLLRLTRRIGGVRAGSASFIYAIGPVGDRLTTDGEPRRRHQEPSAYFVDHTLAVAEIVVRLQEAAHAGTLDLVTVEAETECWRPSGGLSGRWLKPDLFVSVAAGDYDYRWFVEVDRGSEHRPAIVRKCQAYAAYYASGREQARHGVFPRVLWIAPHETRAGWLREVTSSTAKVEGRLFVTCTADDAVTVLSGGDT